MSVDERIREAARVLADHGVPGAEVTAEGHEAEIAAVRVPDDSWDRLLGDDGVRIAAAVKRVGFRYVALDLAGDGGPDAALDG